MPWHTVLYVVVLLVVGLVLHIVGGGLQEAWQNLRQKRPVEVWPYARPTLWWNTGVLVVALIVGFFGRGSPKLWIPSLVFGLLTVAAIAACLFVRWRAERMEEEIRLGQIDGGPW